jgi:hypothetical protein
MKILDYEREPMEVLQIAREDFRQNINSALMAGSNLADYVKGKLVDTLPNIIMGLSSVGQTLEIDKKAPLSKDQHKFLKIVKEIPYSELRELKAFNAEGVKVSYLDFLMLLDPTMHYVNNIQKQVLEPYMFFLAQLVTDKKASISTQNDKLDYQKLEKAREAIFKDFSKMYDKDSYKASCNVKDVVDRNADWTVVLEKNAACMHMVNAIDRHLIRSQITLCTDYLNIIYNNLKSGDTEKNSPEVAERLSNGAYQVASEIQLLSTTHYRALALNGSIENTIAAIVKAVG